MVKISTRSEYFFNQSSIIALECDSLQICRGIVVGRQVGAGELLSSLSADISQSVPGGRYLSESVLGMKKIVEDEDEDDKYNAEILDNMETQALQF